MEWLTHISLAVGALGVGVILWGVFLSTIRFVQSEFAALRGESVDAEKEALRHRLGSYLLLGLEFLVAADIVQSVLTPSLHELGVLGALVAIRTVISFSINWELRQKSQRETPAPPKDAAT